MVTPDAVAAAVIAKMATAPAPFGSMPVRYGRKAPQQGEPPYLVLTVAEQPAVVWESDQKMIPFRVELVLYTVDPDQPAAGRKAMAKVLDGTPATPGAGLVVEDGAVCWSRPAPGRLELDETLLRGRDLYVAGGAWEITVASTPGDS